MRKDRATPAIHLFRLDEGPALCGAEVLSRVGCYANDELVAFRYDDGPMMGNVTCRECLRVWDGAA